MLHDQNPGSLLRFDPKLAVEFADFSDSELLTIVAGEVEKSIVGTAVASKAARSETAGTTAISGKLCHCASGADADGQGQDATKYAIARM